jgi:hypothetical protein
MNKRNPYCYHQGPTEVALAYRICYGNPTLPVVVYAEEGIRQNLGAQEEHSQPNPQAKHTNVRILRSSLENPDSTDGY